MKVFLVWEEINDEECYLIEALDSKEKAQKLVLYKYSQAPIDRDINFYYEEWEVK